MLDNALPQPLDAVLTVLFTEPYAVEPLRNGCGWNVISADGSGLEICDGDGDGKWYRRDPGKWIFDGLTDADLHGSWGSWPNQIKIAKTKKPDVIAREVKRRLYDAYLEAHHEAMKLHATALAKERAWNELVKTVAEVLHGRVRGGFINARPNVSAEKVAMEYGSQDTTIFTVNVPQDRAPEFAEVVQMFLAPKAHLTAEQQ